MRTPKKHPNWKPSLVVKFYYFNWLQYLEGKYDAKGLEAENNRQLKLKYGGINEY